MSEPAPYADPYQPLRDHVELAITALELPHETAERLRWNHEAAMTLDPVAGVPRYLDGSPDTAAWLRSTEKRDARLLGKNRPASTKPPASADVASASITDLFAGSARGDAAATAELDRRSRSDAGAPTEAAPNLTQAMARAHAGDPAAQAVVDRFFS